tara:strand:+ start:3803 stop:4174 length:372 start_codon:yes stop_codon:yes gene_type:complete
MKEKLDKIAESFLGSKKSRDIISRRFRINVSDPLKKLKNQYTNETKKRHIRSMSQKGFSENYKKTMGFEHKTPGVMESMFRKLPVPNIVSNPIYGTGKTKSIKNRAMEDQLITGGRKKLVKGT